MFNFFLFFFVYVVVAAGFDFICKILCCFISADAWHRHNDAAIDCAAFKHGGLFMYVVKVDPIRSWS